MNRRTDAKLAAMVDAASGSCSVRKRFWKSVKRYGFLESLYLLENPEGTSFWVEQLRNYHEERQRVL